MAKLKSRKLWLALLALALLSPLGLIAEGPAWGEWGGEELEDMLGFVPSGFNSLAGLWQAPATNYSLPGLPDGVGYVLSGLLGVLAVAGATFVLGRWLGRDSTDG